MNDITLVLFDVGNVILRATHQITFAILWELGVRPDKVALFFHQNAYGQFSRGKISGAEFAEATRAVLEAPWLTDRQIRSAHDAHIYMLDVDVVKIIEQLSQQSKSLGFVTTTNEWQTAREREFIELMGIGLVVRSHLIGMSKTDEGAWPVILRAFNIGLARANKVFLVDDSSANIAAASGAGLETHLFNTRPQEGAHELREVLKARGVLR